MPRIALVLCYNGSGHSGWQTQSDGCGIQDLVDRAIGQVAGELVRSVAAGRTDAGVHATHQVVHFDTQANRPHSAWVRGVNALLPGAIAVRDAIDVSAQFHARFDARRRQYRYLIYRGANRHALLQDRAAWEFHSLDVGQMHQAASCLVGRHDFTSFRSAQCQARTPVRQLFELRISEDGPMLELLFVADAFLHHMVRNIVGALVWVGSGRRPSDWLADVLQARDRRLAANTYGPQGLYLTGVQYDDPGLIPSWHDSQSISMPY